MLKNAGENALWGAAGAFREGTDTRLEDVATEAAVGAGLGAGFTAGGAGLKAGKDQIVKILGKTGDNAPTLKINNPDGAVIDGSSKAVADTATKPVVSVKRADGTIDLEERLDNYITEERGKAIESVADEEGLNVEVLNHYLSEYDYLHKEQTEIIQNALKEKHLVLRGVCLFPPLLLP